MHFQGSLELLYVATVQTITPLPPAPALCNPVFNQCRIHPDHSAGIVSESTKVGGDPDRRQPSRVVYHYFTDSATMVERRDILRHGRFCACIYTRQGASRPADGNTS